MKSNSKTLKVLIAGGGTGGHLFPGMSIAEALEDKRSCDIRFVGTTKGIEMRAIPKTHYQLYTIPVSGLYRVGFLKKVKTLLKLPLAVLKSLLILLSFRPHLVVGIGGYASGPVMALSVLLRKRTIIQEQNAHPGMTNRLLGKMVELSFIPFAQSLKLFKNPIVVGNPIRKAITESAANSSPPSQEPIVISIVGGSQGAHILNKVVVESLPQLAKYAGEIQIIHQTGQNDYDWVESEYQKHPQIKAQVSEFIDDMAALYQKSSLFISRAGSMINEIIAMGRASILVPIAISSGDHQKENARTMAEAGAGIMIEEKEFNPDHLVKTLESLFVDKSKLQSMGLKARELYRGDSAAKIVDETLKRFQL